MKVNDINQGEKANYSINGNILTIEINDQSVNIDLESKQEDKKRTIDICLNENGELVQEINNWYVANIHIPAASYSFIDTGEVDDQGNTVFDKVKDDLNAEDVGLDLWALPNFITSTNEGVIE
jgi:hypothetical protein